ncbi:MAG: Calx-beta domain-containing protein, partial [Synechocystis sp.]
NLSDTFKLHSNPDASHTVYLDFTGHITENTSWNNYFNNPSINSPAYDNNGDPNSFSDAELALIQQVWLRVAEDFAPFNINITTEEPVLSDLIKSDASDTRWGVRVVVTADTERTNAGGLAYINSFNWNSDTPAWVFNTGEIGVAAAISHEVGHTLGLSHDGTSSTAYYNGHGSGETGWGPIMGSGYYQNVTTWDDGTYYNSNNGSATANYNKGPDDLAIITSYNGFSYQQDDHANTFVDASNLILGDIVNNQVQVSQFGLIERNTDRDYFAFSTGEGTINLAFNSYYGKVFIADGLGNYTGQYLPTPFDGNGSSNDQGSNLDIQARLFDSNQNLIATSNPTGLSANFTDLFLFAGDYYIEIDGVGFGSPTASNPTGYSDYGSLGQYYISGLINPFDPNPPVNPSVIEITSSPQTVVEGLTVNQTVLYTISLDTASAQGITVEYATQTGSATEGSDYTHSAGILTFNPGETVQTIAIAILNDDSNEADKTFALTLSNPTNANLGNTTAIATTITDTLTTGVTTTLAEGIENLTLTGSEAINGTGNAGNNQIVGNDSDNTLNGELGQDWLTGMGGNDLFNLAGINNTSHRKTITDFSSGDRLGLADSLTSRSGGGSPVFQSLARKSSVKLSTSSIDVFGLNFNNTESDVDLSTAIDGSELLDGLNSASGSASLSTQTTNAQGYLLAYDNDNAYLYHFGSGSDTKLIASEIQLIGTLDSSVAIAVGALTAAQFTFA